MIGAQGLSNKTPATFFQYDFERLTSPAFDRDVRMGSIASF